VLSFSSEMLKQKEKKFFWPEPDARLRVSPSS
jgi:hypothetical protein